LITHSSGELTVLHLNSLVREIISRSVGSGNGIDVNEVAMQAVVADANAQALLAISLEPSTLGDSALISAANSGSGIAFASPSDVYVNEERQTAYVSDSQLNAIFLVDLTNGNRILLSK